MVNKNRVLVCIPTYNEAKNIEWIVTQVRTHFARGHVLIVDDNSPDNTGRIADTLANQFSNVHVLHRPHKQGLGKAHGAALCWGLDAGYDYLIQFDADGSHDAGYLNEMMRRLSSTQMVVASRLVHGGGSENWSAQRKLLSAVGNWYAQKLLSIDIRDLTAGFNGFHRALLESIHFEKMLSSGYGFQIELKYRCVKAGAQFQEMPIIFKKRKAGRSKMGFSDITEALVTAARLRVRNV